MHGHARAGPRPAAVGRLRHHDADDLMAEHHRLAEDRLARRAVRPVVQVGAADAAVGDLDHGLVGRGSRLGKLVDAEVVGGVGDDGDVLAGHDGLLEGHYSQGVTSRAPATVISTRSPGAASKADFGAPVMMTSPGPSGTQRAT